MADKQGSFFYLRGGLTEIGAIPKRRTNVQSYNQTDIFTRAVSAGSSLQLEPDNSSRRILRFMEQVANLLPLESKLVKLLKLCEVKK